jgi:hypothetical protein
VAQIPEEEIKENDIVGYEETNVDNLILKTHKSRRNK